MTDQVMNENGNISDEAQEAEMTNVNTDVNSVDTEHVDELKERTANFVKTANFNGKIRGVPTKLEQVESAVKNAARHMEAGVVGEITRKPDATLSDELVALHVKVGKGKYASRVEVYVLNVDNPDGLEKGDFISVGGVYFDRLVRKGDGLGEKKMAIVATEPVVKLNALPNGEGVLTVNSVMHAVGKGTFKYYNPRGGKSRVSHTQVFANHRGPVVANGETDEGANDALYHIDNIVLQARSGFVNDPRSVGYVGRTNPGDTISVSGPMSMRPDGSKLIRLVTFANLKAIKRAKAA